MATSSPASLSNDDPRNDGTRQESNPAFTPTELRLDAVRERIGHDEKILRMLAIFFIGDAPQLVAQIHAAIEFRDGEQLSLKSHSLKGLAANLDVNDVCRLAHQLEACGRREDFPTAATVLLSLRGSVDHVIVLLRREILHEA